MNLRELAPLKVNRLQNLPGQGSEVMIRTGCGIRGIQWGNLLAARLHVLLLRLLLNSSLNALGRHSDRPPSLLNRILGL